jgi:DNA adenine methylase
MRPEKLPTQPEIDGLNDVVQQRSAAIRYPGAKWSLAPQIVAEMVTHYHYVEPYFGSGAVFFTKPVSPHEIINDTNGALVNFFRILRERTDDLIWSLETTPWSRHEYNMSDSVSGEPLEDARRFVVRVWQAHASDLAKKTGWKNRGPSQRARGMSIRWQRVPADLLFLAERLQDAEIECRPALELIERFSATDCLIYADPPYLPETRTQKMYAEEMTEEDHLDLLRALRKHKGPAVLSGYANDLYDHELSEWRNVSLRPPKVEKGAGRIERLWIKDC